jgi:hypothetical protein
MGLRQIRTVTPSEIFVGGTLKAMCHAGFNRILATNQNVNLTPRPYRASGLNLVTAAEVLWNSGYQERITAALRDRGHDVDTSLLQYLSSLGGSTPT